MCVVLQIYRYGRLRRTLVLPAKDLFPSLMNTFKLITQKSPGLMCTCAENAVRNEGQESTSSTQHAQKTKLASLPANIPQTTKLKQKP